MDRVKALYELSELFRLQSKSWAQDWARHNDSGLTLSEASLLDILCREGPQQPSAVAGALLITTGGVTGISDRLVERGLIARTRDDRDRRVVYLGVTEAGRDKHRQVHTQREERLQRMLKVLSDEEISELLRIYRKLTDSLGLDTRS